jgi:hypothetical protein
VTKQTPIVFKDSIPTGWNCSIYNIYNDILTSHCKYCKYCKRPDELSLAAINIALNRQGIYTEARMDGIKPMADDGKDLFIKIFAQEKTLVKDMDSVTLRNRKLEIRQIITEAKVRSAAIDDEERERAAKLSQEQRSWLVTDKSTDPNVTDAIDAVNKRKQRQSKADKLAASLSNLFGDDSTVSELMAKVERKQTGAAVTSSASFGSLIDKRPVVKEEPKSVNTQESLLAETATNLVKKISDVNLSTDDIVKTAVLAGHLGNKVLGPDSNAPEKKAVSFSFSSFFKK